MPGSPQWLVESNQESAWNFRQVVAGGRTASYANCAPLHGTKEPTRMPRAPSLVESDPAIYDVQTSAAGPSGSLPLTEELLRNAPSGDLFGWSQDVGMGWKPAELGRKEFLILSTSGGLRADDGSPIALGYHSGHWE